jgi:hypothetical protein
VIQLGDFLIVLPKRSDSALSHPLFEHAMAVARKLGRQQPRQVEKINETQAASFPRLNGTASQIAVDKGNGDWLLTSGTWFHPNVLASDRERALLRRYQEVGVRSLAQELEGFFVVVIRDGQSGATYAITDVVGSCHAFWRQLPTGVLLSGSSLLLAGQDQPAIDTLAWQEFLNLGVIYEDRTLFSEVRKLKPASIYRFENGTLAEVERYWLVGKLKLESRHGQRAAEALWENLCQAAKRVESLFPNPVCDLTGGYDSRALVSAFLGAGFGPATVVSGPLGSGDVQVSQELAQVAGLKHRHIRPRFELDAATLRQALEATDGEYDLVEYARILTIHSGLSREFDASCNGSFGEVARGFWWEVLWPNTRFRKQLDAMKVVRARYAMSSFGAGLFARTRRVDMVAHLAEVIRRTLGQASDLPITSQMDQIYLWMRMQRWQGRIASSTNRVWPCLSPFLLRSVLEVMLETEARFRRRSLLIRTMLARFCPAWAQVPLEHGYPAQPANLKNLHRFLPLGTYYGRKIISKSLRLAGISRGRAAAPESGVSVREQLWAQEDVRPLLEMRRVFSTGLFDETAFPEFLQRSRLQNPPQNDVWTRLLTLECTLEALERLRT